MNCDDISMMLDDGDCTALDADGRRAVDLHLATCPDCRQAWSVHARLVGKTLPTLPHSLFQQCEAVVAADATIGSRRRLWRRMALATGVAALAAAAAIFALRPQSGSDVAGAAAARTEQPAQLSLPDVSQSGAASSPALRDVSVGKPIRAPRDNPVSFRVEASPVDSLDEADRAAFDSFHVAFVEALRRTPGVVLLVAEDAEREVVDPFFIGVVELGECGTVTGRRIPRQIELPRPGITGRSHPARSI